MRNLELSQITDSSVKAIMGSMDLTIEVNDEDPKRSCFIIEPDVTTGDNRFWADANGNAEVAAFVEPKSWDCPGYVDFGIQFVEVNDVSVWDAILQDDVILTPYQIKSLEAYVKSNITL